MLTKKYYDWFGSSDHANLISFNGEINYSETSISVFLGKSKLIRLHHDSDTDSEGSADYTGSYSHDNPDYDASLDMACGFNFQNKFWLAGGWTNSRQVLFQYVEHIIMVY